MIKVFPGLSSNKVSGPSNSTVSLTNFESYLKKTLLN